MAAFTAAQTGFVKIEIFILTGGVKIIMKWEYVDCRPGGFEYWHAYWGKPTNKNKCELAVTKIGDKRYTIRWYDRDITDIKVHIDAKNFEDAKEQAIKIVRNTLTKRVSYWQAMLNGYNKWLEGI